MKRRLHILLLSLWMMSLIAGCASVASSGQFTHESKGTKNISPAQPNLDDLSERDKWGRAKKAYSQAQVEEKLKHTETATSYYELTLQLLGSMDPSSIGVSTSTILNFQRQVLNSYDKFLASVESLPANAGRLAVLESGAKSADDNDDIDLANPVDRDTVPIIISSDRLPLPSVPRVMNGRVQDQISFFQGRGRKVFNVWMERTAEILPRLRPIMREEGIPEDLVYLAMIESGLNHKAYSYAHASGLWQFIPGTARIYGLHVDRLYDERRHLELATRASCRYLRKLYEEFGDWYLAMAGYNCGERRVEREIQRSKTRDYFRLERLPRQTRTYVPIYLAAREICSNPTAYGFPRLPKEIPFECERIWVRGGYELDRVAQAAGVDATAVRDMNPEFMRGVIPQSESPFMLRLPKKPPSDFESRLASLPKVNIKPVTDHKVRRGETLASIARQYGTSADAIREMPENRRLKTNKLKVGQVISIPVPSGSDLASRDKPSVQVAVKESQSSTDAQSADVADKNEKTVEKTISDQIVYTVHKGETVSKIALQLGVSVEQILQENKISDRNQIAPGQKLKITVQTKTESVDNGKMKFYTVQPGDTIWSIARIHGQEPTKIYSWNKLDSDSTIFPGQKLVVGIAK